ncbi:MAG: hypothetical protein QXX38_02885 [Candidatus Aenigmatarchaeota archaeon]
MRILRNIGKATMIIVFSLSLTFSVLTLFIYNLTTYENAKNIFISVYMNAIIKNASKQEIETLYNSLSYYCERNSTASFTILENITLKCSEFLGKNSTYLVYLIAEKSFDSFYFKNYGCEFLDCIRNIKSNEDIVVFFSLTAHDFIGEIIKPLFIITLVSAALLLILIETWNGRLKLFGIEFLSYGVFFFLLPYIKTFLLGKLPEEVPVEENTLDLVLSQLSPILLIFFALGVFLIGCWFLLKVFGKKSK